MQKEKIDSILRENAFDFFYWFSRFEFCLKEAGIFKSEDIGRNAEPGWSRFVSKYENKFQPSKESERLMELDPKCQKIGANSSLEWKSIHFDEVDSDLFKVVKLVKTIRNNLFHGGKHGDRGWDNPDRSKELLTIGKIILDQLAEMASFEEDYKRLY